MARAEAITGPAQAAESKDVQSVNDWRGFANGEMPNNNRGSPRTSQAARHSAVFREGVAPENTPQRVCPHLPILRKHDSVPFVRSMATLARRMQRRVQVNVMQDS
jgi:hypothetical protein